MHAAQGMTRDAAIGVLDTGHGRLSGQAALYVEASRARERFALVTDNRETLAEALEENHGAGMTAREAVGEDDDPSPGAPGAALGMLRELRDDWRALAARAEAEDVALSRMDDYARIVTGVAALADETDLPADLAAFAAEVRDRDAGIVERRNRELAFVQQADMHCRKQPLLEWAAAERGKAMSELPEHAEWRAEGEALAETGRRLEENRGIVGRVAAALARIVRSFRIDDAERFREDAVRHEAAAAAAGIEPRAMPGAERLAERAAALSTDGLPDEVRRTVEGWSAASPAPEAAPREVRRDPRHDEAGRLVEAFLQDCRDHMGRAAGIGPAERGAPEEAALDGWVERADKLRRDGLRMLGEGAGVRLNDPARIRLAGAANERDRVRDAVDALAGESLRLRAAALVDLDRRVEGEARAAGWDPADLPSWDALKTLAGALRDEPGLDPEAKGIAEAALAHDARVEVETAPAASFLEECARHLGQRDGMDEQTHDRGVGHAGLEELRAWREGSTDLRETARRLLGQSPGDATEVRAAARLANMPRLRDRVAGVLGRLEQHELRDRAADFRAAAGSVEARARERETLPLHAEGYGRATEMARSVAGQKEQPAPVRREAGAWLDRDREWREHLASVRDLTGEEGRRADPAQRREAAELPAVAEAVRRETGRLAGLPPLERGIRWTGDAPLIAGDRLAFRADGETWQAAVESPGLSGGLRGSDTLALRIADPHTETTPAGGRLVEIAARVLAEGGCIRAAWSDAGLRELELARQRSVPLGDCRLPCREPVPGDRIAWTEAAGPAGEVRTVEAEVVASTATGEGHALDLRVVRATGPGAPEPGATIGRTAEAVTGRGCFRAEWRDEARRERVLRPPQQEHKQDRSQGRGFSM